MDFGASAGLIPKNPEYLILGRAGRDLFVPRAELAGGGGGGDPEVPGTTLVNFWSFADGGISVLTDPVGVAGTGYSVQSTLTRSPGYALKTAATGSATGGIGIGGWSASNGNPTSASIATSYIRFYFRYAVKPGSGSEEFFILKRSTGASYKLFMRLNSTGTISLYDHTGTGLVATGTTVLSQDTWYRIELKCGTGADGAVPYELRIDGETELSGSDGSFHTSIAAYCFFGKRVNRSNASVEFYYDDFAWLSDGFIGAGESRLLLPAGSGTYGDWTPSAGTIWEAVDGIPVPTATDSTPYISSSTLTQRASAAVQSASVAGVAGTVRSVLTIASVIRGGGSNGTIVLETKSGATIDALNNLSTGAAWVMVGKVNNTDPNTEETWTLANVAAAEPVIRNINTNASRCQFLGLLVEYLVQPAGYWKLDNFTANGILDYSGNGNHAVWQNGASLVADAPASTGLAQCVVLDGINDYISVSDSSEYELGSNWTVGCWLKFTTVDAQMIFMGHDEGSGDLAKWLFWYNTWTDEEEVSHASLQFHINGFEGAEPEGATPLSYDWSPSTGTWYHVAATRRGSTWKLFLDAVEVASASDSSPMPSPAASLTFGQAESMAFMEGRICDVRIYHQDLAAAQIAEWKRGLL